MKVIAFVPGRPKPQPRVTQNVKFLFGRSVEHWMLVDAQNTQKAILGMINKRGKPYKPTRYAYRLQRLQGINEYRRNVQEVVSAACNGNIPHSFLFFFYLFKMPNNWGKKKKASHEWTLHSMKPDYSNLLKGVEDCLYEEDSKCNAVAHYKLYVPAEIGEGLLILEDTDIHKYIMEAAIDAFKASLFPAV